MKLFEFRQLKKGICCPVGDILNKMCQSVHLIKLNKMVLVELVVLFFDKAVDIINLPVI
jgi:hypothetical protein